MELLPPTSQHNLRLNWIDYIKGIAIILVVLGHLDYTPDNIALKNCIYSLHMPMFFVLAGCTAQLSINNKSVKQFIANKFQTLLIPYTFWNFIILPFSNGDSIINYDFYERFEIFITGRGNNGGMFWFLVCLLALQVIFSIYTILERKGINKLSLFTFLTISYTAIIFTHKTWGDNGNGLGIATQLYFYFIPFWFGICLIKHKHLYNFFTNKYTLTFFILLLFYITNIRTDFNNMSTIARMTGIGTTCILIKLFSTPSLSISKPIMLQLSNIGKYSLAIYIFSYIWTNNIHLNNISALQGITATPIFFLYLPLSIGICYFSMTLEKIINISPSLSFLMLGKKHKTLSI